MFTITGAKHIDQLLCSKLENNLFAGVARLVGVVINRLPMNW